MMGFRYTGQLGLSPALDLGFDIRARAWHEPRHHPILNPERSRRG